MKQCIREKTLGLICMILLTCGYSLGQVQADSCDCEEPSLEVAFAAADFVVEGTCVFANTNWMSGGAKYTFEVAQSWKRSTDQLFVVNTPFESQCGAVFEEGKTYLVFVEKKFSFKTFACRGNRLAAGVDVTVLGDPMFPKKSPMATRMIWTISILALLASLFIGFVVLRKKIRPDSSSS